MAPSEFDRTDIAAMGGSRAVGGHPLARTGHLPYLVACALRELGGNDSDQGLSGSGFRDMTRLAASDPRVAGAYCRANARAVSAAWRSLRESSDQAVATLDVAG